MTSPSDMNRTTRRLAEGAHTIGSARELVVGSLGSDPWERIEAIREAGKRKARAAGVHYEMERERKIVLERLKSEHARRLAGENVSEAKLERLARSDDRYREHVKGTAAALEEKEEAESEYWSLRSEAEWDRAALAHLNSMSKLEEPA